MTPGEEMKSQFISCSLSMCDCVCVCVFVHDVCTCVHHMYVCVYCVCIICVCYACNVYVCMCVRAACTWAHVCRDMADTSSSARVPGSCVFLSCGNVMLSGHNVL